MLSLVFSVPAQVSPGHLRPTLHVCAKFSCLVLDSFLASGRRHFFSPLAHYSGPLILQIYPLPSASFVPNLLIVPLFSPTSLPSLAAPLPASVTDRRLRLNECHNDVCISPCHPPPAQTQTLTHTYTKSVRSAFTHPVSPAPSEAPPAPIPVLNRRRTIVCLLDDYFAQLKW
ncbi:hypothetical protein E2C01_008688 [Portunus trituberculatus]|uniref:Uncharacterized protein n=1 Tax=Portunus trituberculatus TaxID=210409 RepID=A0A5B7D4J0_PORTR|nr:hypothetical protein [Portunus trituberculatus]